MTPFDVDPDHLRNVAARLRGYADHASHLTQKAEAGQRGLTTGDFPEADYGQRAGTIWDDARPVFTDGLRLASQMLSDTSGRISTAAARYEDTDTRSADLLRDIG
ncbi:type VII secretion target [Actinoplanes teichomyceticus]|nr:type VII secretion target [Actinoplanes teichomyceticus]